MEAFIQVFVLAGVVLNTGILTKIYFKLGGYDAKHDSHEKRLDNLERINQICGQRS